MRSQKPLRLNHYAMHDSYRFYPRLVLRAPAHAFTTAFTAQHIAAAVADAQFMEAIYVASPVLHEECCRWQQGQLTEPRKVEKLRLALARYYARFTSRCTPFGLFAGCAVLDWGPPGQVVLAPARATRHTRLDMHYLCALAQQLTQHPGIRQHLRYRLNTSLYHAGTQFRYVEHCVVQGSPVHQISAVEASVPLVQLVASLSSREQCVPELVALLAEEEADRPAAAAFVEQLIDAQVVVSELEPTVTGPEFFQHLRAVIRRLAPVLPDAAELDTRLEQVCRCLQALDQPGGSTPADYEQLLDLLAPLGVPLEPGKIFQTDTTLGLDENPPATLDAGVQAQLLDALDVLTYLTPAPADTRLADFTRRFQARYDEQEVPLLAALDTESGLPYSGYGASRYSSLVHDLQLDAPAHPSVSTVAGGPAARFMQQKLREAERTQAYTVALTRAELVAQGLTPSSAPLPPSLSVLFRIAGENHLVLESAGGSSATNLLGRFAHAAPVEQLVRELAHQEQECNPAVIFAEICHLPAGRTGNILQRPCLRAFEIPYLAQSTQPAAAQLPVQELTLAVRAGQLVLRCRRSGRVVMPRLSTAHNFSHEALPVYHFLCDLQTQGLQPYLGFDWRTVAPHAQFTPRLTYQQVTLLPAAWYLPRPELLALLAASAVELPQQFAAFRAHWRLPRYFTLADGDNELLIDAENPLLVHVWLDAIRGRETIHLKEFLFDPATSPVRDASGRAYNHQLLALLVRQTPTYTPPPLSATAAAIPREFALGSEWLYYKLYCGQLVADRVLREAVHPLADTLQECGLIDQWFFVRYNDPDHHLRLRWHLPNPEHFGEVVRLLTHFLAPFRASGAVWKVQTDTYRRELERYGTRSMALSEALFCYQSEAVLAQLRHQTETEEEPEPWVWGLAALDELLTAFAYTLPQKLRLAEQLRAAFAAEFGAGKGVKRQLDAKYRKARPLIQQQLAAYAVPPPSLTTIAHAVLELHRQGHLEVSLDNLLGSYLHMLLNRLIPAEARLHELVLYDFLARHYQSCLARQRV